MENTENYPNLKESEKLVNSWTLNAFGEARSKDYLEDLISEFMSLTGLSCEASTLFMEVVKVSQNQLHYKNGVIEGLKNKIKVMEKEFEESKIEKIKILKIHDKKQTLLYNQLEKQQKVKIRKNLIQRINSCPLNSIFYSFFQNSRKKKQRA